MQEILLIKNMWISITLNTSCSNNVEFVILKVDTGYYSRYFGCMKSLLSLNDFWDYNN